MKLGFNEATALECKGQQIAKSLYRLFLYLRHTLILNVELRNGDQHLHADSLA